MESCWLKIPLLIVFHGVTMKNRLSLLPLVCVLMLSNALPVMSATILPASTPPCVPFAQQGGIPPIIIVIYVVIIVISLIAMWLIYEKAGEPGWASIVPIYNVIVWCRIIGRPAWWVL